MRAGRTGGVGGVGDKGGRAELARASIGGCGRAGRAERVRAPIGGAIFVLLMSAIKGARRVMRPGRASRHLPDVVISKTLP